MEKLNVKAFGLALGLAWGGLVFILGVLNILFWDNFLFRLMPVAYLSCRSTVLGNIFSAVLAFIYAGLFGCLIAWFYNRIVVEICAERENKIKKLAKKIWEKKGKPFGSEKDDWREAERIIDGK
ncbi:MAG: DUF2934 domain-containing protein [Candidatus Omnitrophota bacterium]